MDLLAHDPHVLFVHSVLVASLSLHLPTRCLPVCSIKLSLPWLPLSAHPPLPNSTQETTLVHHAYGGYLRSQVVCSGCGAASRRFEACLDVTLEVPPGVDRLEAALGRYTAGAFGLCIANIRLRMALSCLALPLSSSDACV